MRAATIIVLLSAGWLAACGRNPEHRTAGVVRSAYDRRADAIENQGQAQPTPVAREIYEARADAIREEGADRQKGLEGKTPSSGPERAGPGGVP